MIWISHNGKQTELQDMDINHLKNAIAKIKREENWRENQLNILEMEVIFRQVINPITLVELDEHRNK
jgi:hypothetical protein